MSYETGKGKGAQESAPGAGPRADQGSAADSQRHPPRLDANSEGAPVQASTQAPNDVPVLPANASGQDKQPIRPTDEALNPESMYAGRPEEDKNYHPEKDAGV